MLKVNSFFEVKLTLGLGFLMILAGCGSMGAKKHWSKEDARLVSGSNQQTVKPFRVSFYNLENLFDTVDGPNDDAEFLPNSANAWNGERYKSKLRNMAKVIDSIEPDILGLVELENAFVLEDLRSNSSCSLNLDAHGRHFEWTPVLVLDEIFDETFDIGIILVSWIRYSGKFAD